MADELQYTDGNFFLLKYIISLYYLYYFIVLNVKIKPLIFGIL